MHEDSLGMLFPGSALSKGTAGSENSKHPRIQSKFWDKFTKTDEKVNFETKLLMKKR